jgi:hypothetical protein
MQSETGAPTPRVSQFNYQPSKPRAGNHHILNPGMERSEKIEERPHGVFRAGSKRCAMSDEIREQIQSIAIRMSS